MITNTHDSLSFAQDDEIPFCFWQKAEEIWMS